MIGLGHELTALGYAGGAVGVVVSIYVVSIPLLRQWHAGRLYERASRNKWDVGELARVIEAVGARRRR